MSRSSSVRAVATIRGTVLRRLFFPALALGFASGCGSPDSEKELETVRSWTATATLAADERRADAISSRYAEGLVEAARAARTDAVQSLASSATSASDRGRAVRALDSLDRAIGRLAAVDAPR